MLDEGWGWGMMGCVCVRGGAHLGAKVLDGGVGCVRERWGTVGS